MYVNRAGFEISDETYNKLSPKMKPKYSKVAKPAKAEKKPAADKPSK